MSANINTPIRSRNLGNRSIRARNKRQFIGILDEQLARLLNEAARRHEGAASLLGLALKEWLDANEPNVKGNVRKGLR